MSAPDGVVVVPGNGVSKNPGDALGRCSLLVGNVCISQDPVLEIGRVLGSCHTHGLTLFSLGTEAISAPSNVFLIPPLPAGVVHPGEFSLAGETPEQSSLHALLLIRG